MRDLDGNRFCQRMFSMALVQLEMREEQKLTFSLVDKEVCPQKATTAE
jgi:hypothetical protein